MNKKNTYKVAVIEQAIMWMIIFIGFTWMFFFVIDYATALRIKDSMDDLSKYGANFVSRSTNQVNVANSLPLRDNLNNIRIAKINNILAGDINCVIANLPPQNTNSQSIFIVQTNYRVSNRLDTSNFTSQAIVYNQGSSAQIQCTLNVTIN